MIMLLLTLSSFAFANQTESISKARDLHVTEAHKFLDKTCPGASPYLCRLQLESDCRKNSEEACKNLKHLKTLEERAIQSDMAINSFVKIPFYKETAPIKKAKVKDLKIGTPKPRKEMIGEKFTLAQVEEDYKSLLAQLEKINKEEVEVQCNVKEDCKAQPVGHKICGGAVGHLIMSSLDPNYGRISAEINLLSFMDATLQRKLNVAGTCDYNTAPELDCVKGVCQKK